MKKNLRLIATFVCIYFVSFSFQGCGKGIDDPFFSFRTRVKRLAQNWQLVSFNGTEITAIGPTSMTVTYNYNGTTLSKISSPGSTEVFDYGFTMDIDKEGRLTSAETIRPSGIDTVAATVNAQESYWYWGSDGKRKSSIVLDLPGIFENTSHFEIYRLANDELRLIVDQSNSTSSPDGNFSTSTEFDLYFTPIEE